MAGSDICIKQALFSGTFLIMIRLCRTGFTPYMLARQQQCRDVMKLLQR
jgi:hypothetical protein